MEKTYDFLSVGEVLIDMTPARTEGGETCFLPKVGGAPVNAACVLARLGKRATFIGRMGHDAFGDQIKRTLSAAGLDTTLLQRDEERHTTLAFVHLSPEGDRSFSFYRTGLADTRLEAGENAFWAAERTKILHFGSVALAEEPERTAVLTLAHRGKTAGAWISYDPNLRPGLWHDQEEMRRAVRDTMPLADILKLSEEEAEELLDIAEPEKAALRLGGGTAARLPLSPAEAAGHGAAAAEKRLLHRLFRCRRWTPLGRVTAFWVRRVMAFSAGRRERWN